MIRFLADASLHHAVVRGCLRREPSMDFLSAHKAGLEGVPDPDVLAIAAAQQRILVTSDIRTMPVHFARFIESGRSCSGVFFVKQKAAIGEVIELLVAIWAASEPEEWTNRFVEIP